ncbi:hypothetical protein C2S53_014743 [Perilla frutescens var. hirtella]|uniref:Reverse transcriptase zinc-binding domain-containing protein n=1 Tax=Perilla frutescens var. hirtella TaxID=608512 RepID=A0AAD4JC42_PERFH|nr:hypothetical protein C2S53_014743 [Perilla frutescens var. hirtella]
MDFHRKSNLTVNVDKSSVFTVGIARKDPEAFDEISHIMGCPEGTFPVRREGLASKMATVGIELCLHEWRPKIHDSPLIKSIANIRDEMLTIFGNGHNSINELQKLINHHGLCTGAVYNTLRSHGQIQPCKIAIWKHFIPSKYSFTLWLAFHGHLNTKDGLAFLEEDENCCFCFS